MKTTVLTMILALTVLPGTVSGGEIGRPAPGFELKDVQGTTHSLVGFKGKTVVLEWTNHDCPFVKKHYGTRNMQMLQEKYTGKGVVWLTICSSAEGKQGHYSPDVWQKKIEEQGSHATAMLLDVDGKVGRKFGAKTTPHLFVIGPDGTLKYAGAIDDNPSWNPKTVEGARNYVAEALDAVLAGKSVDVAETKSYGCSVKY